MTLLTGERLVVLDAETTGMSPGYGAAAVEVARVDIESDAIGGAWSTLLQPGRSIPSGATEVHGITDAMVAGAPSAKEVAVPLREAIGERTVILHNASFDLPFLVAMMREAGAPPILNPVVDTLGLARGLLGPGSNALSALAERLEVPAEPPHRALPDALTTARVFLALADRWERERGIRSLAELAAASQDVIRSARR